MKKLFYNILTMAVIAIAAVSFSSCEDAQIASTLEGTWKGNMYISTSYDGRTYDATYTEITFDGDPYSFSSGTGYWVDYYSNAPWDYVANHISWSVDNRVIYIHFYEDGTSFRISDYRLNDDRFVGTLYDNGNYVDFDLVHTSSPNWGRYNYWGYDSWFGTYYSRTRGEGASDSTAVEKPIRYIRGK
ncbi:MAG: lipocalin family protein [Prevotella sp.]|jgi:hypothetical protein|nr:lipocalin family protein [Prevotella sp.]